MLIGSVSATRRSTSHAPPSLSPLSDTGHCIACAHASRRVASPPSHPGSRLPRLWLAAFSAATTVWCVFIQPQRGSSGLGSVDYGFVWGYGAGGAPRAAACCSLRAACPSRIPTACRFTATFSRPRRHLQLCAGQAEVPQAGRRAQRWEPRRVLMRSSSGRGIGGCGGPCDVAGARVWLCVSVRTGGVAVCPEPVACVPAAVPLCIPYTSRRGRACVSRLS